MMTGYIPPQCNDKYHKIYTSYNVSCAEQLFCGGGPKSNPLRRPRQTSLSSPCRSTSRSYPPQRNRPLASTFWCPNAHCCGHGQGFQQRRRLTIWHAGGRGNEAKRGGGGPCATYMPSPATNRELNGAGSLGRTLVSNRKLQ